MGYLDKLESGAITLIKTEDGSVLTVEKRFDPSNGQEAEPEVGTWAQEAHIDQAIAEFSEQWSFVKDTLDYYQKIKEKFAE